MIIDDLLDKACRTCRRRKKTPFCVAWRMALESFIDHDNGRAHELAGEVFSVPELSRRMAWDQPGESGLYYELVQNVLAAHWRPFEILLEVREPGYEALSEEHRVQARFAQTSLR